jgi:hypothetical protein
MLYYVCRVVDFFLMIVQTTQLQWPEHRHCLVFDGCNISGKKLKIPKPSPLFLVLGIELLRNEGA